ncbi:2Fe-2S iron-sulfur cluster-binding protein [Nonomuraea rhizosphaerae]|uniref:2Fe-2S iron-sulfur cluster-binding protein n=1 Tax=Nonomuraea rhizosphaerae TaxID=2665663 RepID=UPI001C5E4049|nr:2Fe-2S iron-sulfur cluster-binding protein [Nonomuraea rhizosphaerae]
MTRLARGGLVDRSVTLSFSFDGRPMEGHPGDTLASALLANGVRVVGHSVGFGRPRGVFSAGPEEPNALIRVGADPMLAATTVELYDGLEAWSLRGKGRVDLDAHDDRRCDKGYLHCDVLVVGGGPAGLAAALGAGAAGARVILVDDQPRLGGDLLNSRVRLDGAPALDWVALVRARLRSMADVRVFSRTTAIGYYDHNYVVAVERRPRGERLWHLRAGRVVLATGAHERSLAFPGNDRPGVMLASAARTYANRYGVRPGRRAVVFACADSGYEAARDLLAAGVEIAAVVDPRPRGLALDGVEVLAGQVVTGTTADAGGLLTGVLAGDRSFEADLLAVAGGWNPAVHLFSQSQGRTGFDEDLQAFVPRASAQGERSAGACAGRYGTPEAIEDGYTAGHQAATPMSEGGGSRVPESEGDSSRVPEGGFHVPVSDEPAPRPPAALWLVEQGSGDHSFADLHRDVTVADLARAAGTGMRSVEHVKRYTTAGTGADQGKTSGAVVVGVMSALLGAAPGQVGTTTYRPPYTPVSFATLAGRDRGTLSDPVRTTAPHASHVARGAVFEDVGQWKRPRYFPREGETMEQAVLRECHAARTAVAAMDASTLGKIDIRGADAGEFLDRIYTNMYSTLRVGSCRYGVMCTADGMVFDDGTTARLADDHYLMTTTTGNAAPVLDWLEEWRQTEWPDLDVSFTSVTDHWATVAVAGPHAREIIQVVAPGALDLAFMTYAGTDVLGVPGRVFRISFSGELAYEVNVPWWYGRSLWDTVLDLGAVPYGTETMHVLRAEKGFAIVGQETDGTVTPQDLGMSWLVSKRKPDFVGKRSHTRPDTARADRKHLVGLLTDDPAAFVEEGAQLVLRMYVGGDAPVPMLGHVTSSYPSAALGRSFSLAMARDVAVGDRLVAVSGETSVPVTVVEPVFYDPGNTRRDGRQAMPAFSGVMGECRRRSPAEAYAARFAAAGSERVRLREVPFERMWEVRGSDPGTGLRLGPDWWLVTGDVQAGESWVDVSGQRTVLELTGPGALDILITGCPIDLHPSVFPGHAQTLLGKTTVLLEKIPDGYRIYVRSSFASYVSEWLLSATEG